MTLLPVIDQRSSRAAVRFKNTWCPRRHARGNVDLARDCRTGRHVFGSQSEPILDHVVK